MIPVISVCIPTYNGSTYLRECLDSITNQTFTDYEILIVDDNSEDKTVEIVKEYQSKDSRIRLVENKENIGLVKNWNKCIDLAKGEWIKFVFQDDFLHRNCLAKMFSYTSKKIGLIYCQREFLFEQGIPNSKKKESYKYLSILEGVFSHSEYISPEEYCNEVLNFINYPGFNLIGEPTVVMIHRSIFQKFGNFNANFVQICDEEFWTRVAIHTGLIYIQEKLVTFRIHNKSVSLNNYKKNFYEISIIDPLLRLQEICLNPIYHPIRDVAEKRFPPLDLSLLLQKRIYIAWLKSFLSFDRQIKAKWASLVAIYPQFTQVLKLDKVFIFLIKKTRNNFLMCVKFFS